MTARYERIVIGNESACVDLSFTFFDRPVAIVPGCGAIATLLVDAAVRQGASPTALIQGGLQMAAVAGIGSGLFAPSHGSFNARVAARLIRWKQR